MRSLVWCSLWGVLALASCAHDWERLSPAQLPGPAEYPRADLVVLLDEVLVEARPGPKGEPVLDVTFHERVRILAPGGERAAHVAVPFQPGRSEVLSFAARAVGPDGTERRFGRGDAAELPLHADFELYSDHRALSLELKPSVPGTVLETRYTVRYHDWRLSEVGQRFAGRAPVRLARLEVRAPSGWQLEHVAREAGRDLDFPPAVETRDGEQRLVWERRDLPALEREPHGLSIGQLAPTVHVRLRAFAGPHGLVEAARDPRELSAFVYRHLAPPTSTSATARARAIVGEQPREPLELARTLHAWVRDHVSYCAIEIGDGGTRPHSADDVLRHSYGDCKDKANLLRELLAAVGVPSHLVHVNAHDGWAPRFTLPTGNNFNHAILEVELPAGPVLADPTSPVTAFGELPIDDQESPALPITEEGGGLITTPGSRAEDNREQVRLDLAPVGADLLGRLEADERGAYADHLRGRLLQTTEAERERAVARVLVTEHLRLHNLQLDGAAPQPLPLPLTAHASVQLPRALQDGWLALRLPELFGTVVPELPDDGQRRSPVLLRHRRQVEHVVRVHLPASASVTPPQPLHLESPEASYDLTFSRDEDGLTVTRRFELREHVIPAERYSALRALFHQINTAEARSVAVRLRGNHP